MITEQLYNEYLSLLLQGKKMDCSLIVENLMEQGIEIKKLYTDLFQRSLYAVGELWEKNEISVAKEHLATAITESLMNLVYPWLFESDLKDQKKTVVISCSVNEYHQVGGKMVADIFQLHGWDGYFLGANTPADHLLSFIEEIKPDLVGLSLSVYLNLPSLKGVLALIRSHFSSLKILLGGQAFKQGGAADLKNQYGALYIQSLYELEPFIS